MMFSLLLAMVVGQTPVMIPSAPMSSVEAKAADSLMLASEATATVGLSGKWNEVETWANGILPGMGANVFVPNGKSLIVEGQVDVAIKNLRVEGILWIQPGCTLELETLLVMAGGEVAGGLADQPITIKNPAVLKFNRVSPVNHVKDPLWLSGGVVSMGKLSMYGESPTPFSAVSDNPKAGATTVKLATQPSGWVTGGHVVVAGAAVGQEERRTIAAINGSDITLDKPLTYSHVAPPTFDLTVANRLRVHVAYLDRPIRFECDAKTTPERAHVMSLHSSNFVMSGVSLVGFGRTDKMIPINDPAFDIDGRLIPGSGANPRGRYGIHVHRADQTVEATVRNCVVDVSPGWGIVNHSSRVMVDSNVVLNAVGTSFVGEAGDEVGEFRGNLSIGASGSGKGMQSREAIQDWAHGGHGIWLQGPYPILRGNVVSGVKGEAVVYWADALLMNGKQIELPSSLLESDIQSLTGTAASVSVQAIPGRMYGNVTYGGSPRSVSVFFVGQDAMPVGRVPLPMLIEDHLSWGCPSGFYLAYGSGIYLRRATVVGSSGSGLAMDSSPWDVTVDGGYFDRLGIGVQMPDRGRGVVKAGAYNATVAVVVGPLLDQIREPRSITVDGLVLGPSAKLAIKMDQSRATADLQPTMVRSLFEPDEVRWDGRRLFSAWQAPAFKFVTPTPWYPQAWSGLNSQEIWDRYGVAFGATLAPPESSTIPMVDGLAEPLISPVIGEPSIWGSAIPFKVGGQVVPGKYILRIDGVQDVDPTVLDVGKLNAVRRKVGGRDRTVLVYAQ